MLRLRTWWRCYGLGTLATFVQLAWPFGSARLCRHHHRGRCRRHGLMTGSAMPSVLATLRHSCGAHRKHVRPRPSAAQIYEKSPLKVKNFGIWFRYDSRTGTHNAYKEIREMSLTAAINMMYMDMAGRSRAKSKAIQILKTADVKQFHSQSIRFPLPHRVAKIAKKYRTTFKAARPTTFC